MKHNDLLKDNSIQNKIEMQNEKIEKLNKKIALLYSDIEDQEQAFNFLIDINKSLKNQLSSLKKEIDILKEKK